MIGDESVKALEDLHRLKTDGIITEAEFEASKQRILFGGKVTRPVANPNGTPGRAPPTDNLWGWATLPFRRYADFKGRSSRREVWWFLALTNAVAFVLLLFAAADTDSYGDAGSRGHSALVLLVLWLLACLVPLLAVEVRRLHDQSKSGWLAAINLVPYLGWIVVLVFMALPGDAGDNEHGPSHEGP